MSFLVRKVLESGTIVQNLVIVQDLHVTGLELHVEPRVCVLGDVVEAPESHQQLGDLGFMTTGSSELSSST